MLGSENSESIKGTRRGKPTQGGDANPPAASASGAEHEAKWEDEMRLNDLLRRLPDAPISSNFTARVVNAAERVVDARKQHPWTARLQSIAAALPALGWAPRLAAGAAIVVVTLACLVHYRTSAREELARSVVAVSNVAALPSWDMLANFEAIQRLPEFPKGRSVDLQLLAALR